MQRLVNFLFHDSVDAWCGHFSLNGSSSDSEVASGEHALREVTDERGGLVEVSEHGVKAPAPYHLDDVGVEPYYRTGQ